jgi:hypothetical protein
MLDYMTESNDNLRIILEAAMHKLDPITEIPSILEYHTHKDRKRLWRELHNTDPPPSLFPLKGEEPTTLPVLILLPVTLRHPDKNMVDTVDQYFKQKGVIYHRSDDHTLEVESGWEQKVELEWAKKLAKDYNSKATNN